MRKALWLSAIALVFMAVPALVKAAENAQKSDEVTVTTSLEVVR